MRIADVGASDNGVYSCSARNVAGSVDSYDNFVLNIDGTKELHSVVVSFYINIGLLTFLHCFMLLVW